MILNIYMDQLLVNVKSHMQNAYDVLRTDFSTVRTGKANSSLVENIVINAYGGTQKLKVLELATINIQDAHTIVITPFDHSIIGEIEHGISQSQIGLSPVVDGMIIRISLPPLTEERRRDFVKLIHQKAEGGRVMVRQVRHDAMNEIKKKGESISEDEVTRLEKEVQKLTDEYIEMIDLIADEKEEELMKL